MAPQRIVIINSDPAYLRLMRSLLRDVGYDAFIWHGHEGVLDMVHTEKPELIFLDLRLVAPEEGWVTIEMLRLDPVTRPIPIIVASVDVELLRTKEEMLRALDCLYLEKPVDLERLVGTIQNVIGPPRV
jgi:CheY-like chemotaxis protein